jgi:hypothetical protein
LPKISWLALTPRNSGQNCTSAILFPVLPYAIIATTVASGVIPGLQVDGGNGFDRLSAGDRIAKSPAGHHFYDVDAGAGQSPLAREALERSDHSAPSRLS